MIGLKSDKCDRRAWRVLRDPKKQVSKEMTQKNRRDPCDQRDPRDPVTEKNLFDPRDQCYPVTHINRL